MTTKCPMQNRNDTFYLRICVSKYQFRLEKLKYAFLKGDSGLIINNQNPIQSP